MGIATGPPQFTSEESPRAPLTLFQQRLPTDNGQLHLLVPAGVGDNLWHVGKLWSICQQRDVTFWLPQAEQKRSGDVFRMMGLKYGYMPDLTTDWIWSRPGSPPIPDTGAVLSLQINRHLEHGHRIEKWYPDLSFRNPVEFMDLNVALFKEQAGGTKYVVGFMSQQGYMEYGGNLKPAQWARIWQQVERDVAPVCIIAAGKDVEFAEEVMKFFDPSLAPIFNASLDIVAQAMAGAEMVLGAHAGPLILSTYMGIPTLHAYPRWLAPMPGTWECSDNVWGACFLDELENVTREGIQFTGNECMGRMRKSAKPDLRVYGNLHPRWTPDPAAKQALEHVTNRGRGDQWMRCAACGADYKNFNGMTGCPHCRRYESGSPSRLCFNTGCGLPATTEATYPDGEVKYSCERCIKHLSRGAMRLWPYPAPSNDLGGSGGSSEDTEQLPVLHDAGSGTHHAGTAATVDSPDELASVSPGIG